MSLIKLHCVDCSSECEVYSEMDEHHYPILHCPYCGADMDADNLEDIEDDS